MKRRIIVICIVLFSAIIFSITGFLILEKINMPMPTIPNPEEIYSSSLPAIASSKNISLKISQTKEISVENDVFSEQSQQTLTYNDFGEESMRIKLEETLTIDSHSVEFTELYANNIGYVTIGESKFTSNIAENYTNRFTPAILIDPALYGSITGVNSGLGYIIYFSEPTAAENWAFIEGSEFIDANGTAYVDFNNNLTKSIYNLTYQLDNIRFQLTYTVEISTDCPEIILPEDTSGFISIEYLDGPRTLEKASGYLMQAKNVSSTYSENIYCQFFGDRSTRNIELNTQAEPTWSADVETNTTLSNDSRIGQETITNKLERFTNEKYSVAVNGGEPVDNDQVKAEDMHSYCENLLVGTIMLPQHIRNAKITQTDITLRIDFEANKSFANVVASNACQILYQNSALLDTLSENHTVDTARCYLKIDMITGLPIATGITCDSTYTMTGLPYQFTFKADQSYNVLCSSSDGENNKAAG